MPAREYDNAAVAAVLDAMGDLLEVAGEDKFRFLSYHKAAHAVRAWPEPLTRMADEGRLQEVPGIGKKLALSVGQVLETGTFPEFEELKAHFAPSLVRVMEIPGVGPKRARVLHDELGVCSLEDLEKALAEERLTGLPGFGPKTIANIRDGIESAKRHHERLLLLDALPLAERLTEELRALDGVERAEPAGSLRRWKETVGDVDIIVSSADPGAVMAHVRDLPMVARVLGSGGTKTSVLTTAGIQVDVRVVAPEEFGAALQYFTGNKEHNVQLREIAKKRGMKVSEYGVFRAEDDLRLGGATEEEVYELLGMDTPPPEIRLGIGEVELAHARGLPRLVTLADIRGDLHGHTDSTDSRSSVEQNRAMAAELGYEYVAVSDHAERLKMVKGLTLEQLERQWEHIDRLNAEPGPFVLKATELNIGEDGSVDYPDEVLARFDFCIASLHGGFGDSREKNTKRLLAAMDNPYVDIIGHCTGRILGRRDPLELDMEAVLSKAGETGTVMEINAFPDRLDLRDDHIRMARRYDVRFSLGTDAHAAGQMRYMAYGVATARRGLLAPEELLNAQPVDGLRRMLKRSRVLSA